jgi:hypothetical protein
MVNTVKGIAIDKALVAEIFFFIFKKEQGNQGFGCR